MEVDNTGGQRDGWIYIVTTQKNLTPAGTDPDIILNRSTDGGLTWSSGIRVNQDALNNGKIQYFPAVHIDDFGGVNIIFYDDRNTASDSAGVFLARSVDGGNSWTEYEISDHNFKPAAVGGLGQGYQGDNIGITSSGNILWPVWMDNSSGIYQVWTVPIDITTLDVKETFNIPDEFKLYQNYPNPFNPATTLTFDINHSSFVSFKVYDVLGNEISNLINEYKGPGEYEVQFNASSLPSGIYFYRLNAGTYSKTRKMALIK
ncbi:MAG: T9SS C-terminal target domain-containing protein [Ignavibacteriales bacterium]|nr:MAG: T9SS C-terminal target domain-containing protein [Ignavibacteriales bacterium]